MIAPCRPAGGRTLLALVCALASFDVTAQHAAPVPEPPHGEHYRLGGGYPVPGTRLHFGGYGEASWRDDHGEPWRASLDSLSLIASWDDGAHWSFLGETELKDGLVLGPGDTSTDEAYLSLERFHLDYSQSDFLQFRLGKFLTPIGRWNLIHAAPLTWTTSRPLITESTFPTNATGAMLFGVVPLFSDALDYAVYGSIGEELAPNPELDTFREAYGLRLNYALGIHAEIGLSYANFEQESSPEARKSIFGLDFAWHWRRWELSGEWVYRRLDSIESDADERGYYVQLVAPLGERLYAVARTEYLDRDDPFPGVHLSSGGLSWRLLPALVLKAEYRHATENQIDADEGLLASFAVLF